MPYENAVKRPYIHTCIFFNENTYFFRKKMIIIFDLCISFIFLGNFKFYVFFKFFIVCIKLLFLIYSKDGMKKDTSITYECHCKNK